MIFQSTSPLVLGEHIEDTSRSFDIPGPASRETRDALHVYTLQNKHSAPRQAFLAAPYAKRQSEATR